MKFYEIFSTDADYSECVFRSLKEARAYLKDIGAKEYKIDRITTPPLTLDLLLGVINSQGGSYCAHRETVVCVGMDNLISKGD